jgi:MFS family permease
MLHPRGPFGRFWIGSTASAYGDWFTTVAVMLLLFKLTGTTAAPALYMVARIAPRMLGSTWGGRLADRHGPRGVAIACNAGQAACLFALVAGARSGVVWSVYVAVACSQLLGAMSKPCGYALIPLLVDGRDLGRANGLYGAAQSSSILVAPALAALLTPFTGPEVLLVADACSFVLASALLATLRLRPAPPASCGKSQRGALAVAWHTSTVRAFAGGQAATALAVSVAQCGVIAYAVERLGTADAIGFLYLAIGAGGVCGGVVASRYRRTRLPSARTILWCFGADIAGLALFAILPVWWVAVPILGASTLLGDLGESWGAAAMQRDVDPQVLGRVAGATWTLTFAGMLGGAVLGSVLIPLVGWQGAILSGCGIGAVIVAMSRSPRAHHGRVSADRGQSSGTALSQAATGSAGTGAR